MVIKRIEKIMNGEIRARAGVPFEGIMLIAIL